MHDQDHVAFRHACDRGVVLHRIVAGVLRHRRNHGKRAGVAVEQGIAVGLGGGRGACPERAAGAGAIFDDHALPQRLLHFLRHQACHHVGLTSRRRRHDHLDHPFRIDGLRLRRPGRASGKDQRGKTHASHGGAPMSSHHRFLPAPKNGGVAFVHVRHAHASVPIPKFASLRGTLVCELRNQRDTSNL